MPGSGARIGTARNTTPSPPQTTQPAQTPAMPYPSWRLLVRLAAQLPFRRSVQDTPGDRDNSTGFRVARTTLQQGFQATQAVAAGRHEAENW